MLDASWEIRFVRGPLTAQKLGLDPSLALTDPAPLLLDYVDLPEVKDIEQLFIPHWASEGVTDWADICAQAGMHFLSPATSPEIVIQTIARSKQVVTDSLHGAIFSDALRVPWKSVVTGKGFLHFKWQDWCAAMGLNYASHPLLLAPWEAHMSLWDRMRFPLLKKLAQHRLAPDKYQAAPVRITTTLDRGDIARDLAAIAARGGFMLSTDAINRKRMHELVVQCERMADDKGFELELGGSFGGAY